jgi:MFS family permease
VDDLKFLKFRWVVLVTMFVATIAQGMVLISPAPLVGEIAQSLGLSLGQVTGALMGSFILFVAVSAVVGGISTDKFGVVKTYIGSMVLLIAGSLLVPVLGDSLPGLLISRFIQGCGAGPILASIARLAAEWFPKKERAFVTGLQGAGVSLGIAIGFGLAPLIYTGTGSWKAAMAWMAVGAAAGLVLSLIFALGPKSPVALQDELDPGELLRSAADFKKSIGLPVFRIGAFSVFLLSWAMQGYNDLIPGHLAIEPPAGLGLGPVVAGKFMGLMQVAFMIGSAASGLLVLKIFGGRHRHLIAASFILTGIFCVSVLLPSIHSNNKMLLICLLFSGFFMGMPNPAVLAFISSYYPEHITGRIGGATMGIGILGGVAGVAAGSFALHRTEMYTVSILIVGVVCIIGCINAFGLTPSRVTLHDPSL